jgi:hypothetical protein
MADFDMNAAVSEFNTLTQGDASPESGAQAPTESSPQSQPQPTAQEIANYFETQLDGKPLKLPYNMELPLKHNGQLMKVPLEKLANTYRQFEHIQGKHKDFQTREQEFNQRVGDWKNVEAMKEKYGAIQEWSEKNPEQFEKLWQMYQSKDQILQGEQFNPLVPEIQRLKQELESLKPEIEYYKGSREQEAAKKDIEFVENQIADFGKEYPMLDLNEKDLDGIDLTSRIINFGIQNGHKDFLSAAMSFPGLRQRLNESIRESVKAEMAKQIKSDNKNGILARSTTPSQVKAGDPQNVKRMSPQDRDKLMSEEFNKLISG